MRVEPRLREVAAQTVLAVRRRISIDELDDYIEGSMHFLGTLAPVADAQFVIYCDGLSAGHDGTVEVCQPVDDPRPAGASSPPHRDAAQELPVGVVRRIEPAHLEAYVTVTRSELAYPEIDEIYDALDDACRERGWRRQGPPRELCWANWDFLAMDDDACDVCFPVERP